MTAGWNLVDVVPNGAALYKGNFSVTGNEFSCTNVKEKWIAYDSRTTSYDWKASSNLSGKYEFNEGDKLWGHVMIEIKNWATSSWYYPVKL